MNPADLPADQLRDAAVALLAHPKPHWSVIATLIGRITDLEEYKRPDPEHDRPEGYSSPQAFCEERLDMTAGEYRQVMKLWRTMTRGERDLGAVVSLAAWGTVPRAAALLIGEMQGVGAGTRLYLDKSRELSLKELRAHVACRLGQEAFRRVVLNLPASVYALWTEAVAKTGKGRIEAVERIAAIFLRHADEEDE